MAQWHEELGLGEDSIVMDLGVCPWCGGETVVVAANGKAAGRKPPDKCCLHGTLAGLARIKAGLAISKSREDRYHLEAQLNEVMRHLAGLGATSEEIRGAVKEVQGRYALSVDWASILSGLRRHA